MSDTATHELPVNFSAFLVSLASSAMTHLGEAPDPVSRKNAVDLTLARNTIDLLGLLKEKTKGNLTNEETQLLDTLLYDLRIKFVDACKKYPQGQQR